MSSRLFIPTYPPLLLGRPTTQSQQEQVAYLAELTLVVLPTQPAHVCIEFIASPIINDMPQAVDVVKSIFNVAVHTDNSHACLVLVPSCLMSSV